MENVWPGHCVGGVVLVSSVMEPWRVWSGSHYSVIGESLHRSVISESLQCDQGIITSQCDQGITIITSQCVITV